MQKQEVLFIVLIFRHPSILVVKFEQAHALLLQFTCTFIKAQHSHTNISTTGHKIQFQFFFTYHFVMEAISF